jgi:LCP family protein required for cell wall assembly
MDDLFSNSPRHDDYEDISSHSKPGDDMEDIFSSSDREIHDLFSDFPSESDEESSEQASPRDVDFDLSYFTAESNAKKAGGADMNRDVEEYEDISSSTEKPKKKKRRWLKIAVIILVLAIIGAGVYAVKTYNDIIGKINIVDSEDNKYVGEYDLTKGDGITNILLIGSDTRVSDTSGSRSDTTILLSIDTKSKQLKLTSFLRDTYIEIPERGKNKLNAAFSRGGAQLLMDTLEYNFGVDIDNFIAIDFESFKDIIDALGGIDIEITDNEARYINSQDHMTDAEIAAFPERIEGGMNHFDGMQTLWYCRIRYLDSDFNRTERQRKVLNTALAKAKKTGITDLIEIAKLGASKVTTDISQAQIKAYTQQALSLMKYEIVGMQVPADGTWSNVSTYAGDSLGIDLDKNKELLNQFIYGGPYVAPTEPSEESDGD